MWVKGRVTRQVWGSQSGTHIKAKSSLPECQSNAVTCLVPARQLLCDTKLKLIPALNCSQSLAGCSEHGWGRRSGENLVGWKQGRGRSQPSPAWSRNMPSCLANKRDFHYWFKGGALQSSVLQNHTFSTGRCPLFCGACLAAVGGEDLCW